MSRWLVVNADDAGLHRASDLAILEAAARGVLRSASVAVTGPTAPAFVDAALALGLGLGLHWNLTEGFAAAGPRPPLTDAAGRFALGKRGLWERALAGGLEEPATRAGLAAELEAQLARAARLGFEPDHVDGHNHVHVLPGAREALLDVLARRGRPAFVRVPAPAPGSGGLPGLGAAADLARLGALLRARLGAPLRAPDAFAALGLDEPPCEAALLAGLPPAGFTGVAELMVHPGARPGSPFTEHPDREREARLLRHPGLRARLAAAGWRPSTFFEHLRA